MVEIRRRGRDTKKWKEDEEKKQSGGRGNREEKGIGIIRKEGVEFERVEGGSERGGKSGNRS